MANQIVDLKKELYPVSSFCSPATMIMDRSLHKAAYLIAKKHGQLMTNKPTDISLDNFTMVNFSPELLNNFLNPDGALRDIYVENTSIKDWENILDIFKKSDFTINYFIDEIESNLPANVSSLFTNSQNSVRLQLKKETIIINTYLFLNDQIEFDIDPRDFVTEEQHSVIFEFLKLLSDATNKTIILCEENSADTPFLILLPDKNVYISRIRF